MSVTIQGSAGVTTNSGAVYNGLQTGTAVSASGTSITFTGIPSWVKRITVMMNGVSLSGTANWLIQIGSGSPETSGYAGAWSVLSTAVTSTNYSAGFGIQSNNAANIIQGSMVLTLLNSSTNTWSGFGVFGFSNSAATVTTAGIKSTSGIIDRVVITTTNGTDTFDAGTINIIYE